MGKKGLHISISVVLLGALLLFISFFLSWQDMSSAFGTFDAEVHLTKIDIRFGVVQHHDIHKGLRAARDMACSASALFVSVGDVCATLTRDYVCGVIFILLSVIAITLDFIAVCYLGYYATGSTQRSYRKVAFNCLVVAPVCLGLGLLIYVIALACGTRGFNFTGISMLPGSGMYVACVGTVIMSIVPFLSKTWAMHTSEALSDQRRTLKMEHLDNVLYHTNLQSEESSQVIYNKSLKNEHAVKLTNQPANHYQQPGPIAESEPSSRTNVYCASYSPNAHSHPPPSYATNQPASYHAPQYSNQHTTVSYHQTSDMLSQPHSTLVNNNHRITPTQPSLGARIPHHSTPTRLPRRVLDTCTLKHPKEHILHRRIHRSNTRQGRSYIRTKACVSPPSVRPAVW
eukprot:GEMP01037374.1.p1 GENE.GEMP01037374.1~~GEMP01037374.1.p1  ORF type:complete len:412 (+),score=64.30 GEMP01037374.1:39-1238(+)